MELAGYIATLANGGTRYKLHFVDKITTPDGKVVQEFPSEVVEKIDMKQSTIDAINYKDILLHHERWNILEKSAPKLCADRIDYTLRDMYNNGIINYVSCNVYGETSDIKGKDRCYWFQPKHFLPLLMYNKVLFLGLVLFQLNMTILV